VITFPLRGGACFLMSRYPHFCLLCVFFFFFLPRNLVSRFFWPPSSIACLGNSACFYLFYSLHLPLVVFRLARQIFPPSLFPRPSEWWLSCFLCCAEPATAAQYLFFVFLSEGTSLLLFSPLIEHFRPSPLTDALRTPLLWALLHCAFCVNVVLVTPTGPLTPA